MKHILRETFDFNSVIENEDNAISIVSNKILFDSINENDIIDVVNKIAPDFDVLIENIDNGIKIKIYYDKIARMYVIIELICDYNKVNVYLKHFYGTCYPLIGDSVIQILNYLKDMGIYISDIISFEQQYISNMFALGVTEVSQILTFIKNNYKIKLVNLVKTETHSIIDKLKIKILKSDRKKINMLKSNIINIDKDNTEFFINYEQ